MMTGVDAICVYATKIFQDVFKNDSRSGIYGSLIIGGVNFINILFVVPVAER